MTLPRVQATTAPRRAARPFAALDSASPPSTTSANGTAGHSPMCAQTVPRMASSQIHWPAAAARVLTPAQVSGLRKVTRAAGDLGSTPRRRRRNHVSGSYSVPERHWPTVASRSRRHATWAPDAGPDTDMLSATDLAWTQEFLWQTAGAPRASRLPPDGPSWAGNGPDQVASRGSGGPRQSGSTPSNRDISPSGELAGTPWPA